MGQGEICFRQKVFAFVDAPGDHIIDGGNAVLLFESVGEVEFVHVSLFCQLVQGQGFLEMMIDVPADSGTLMIAHVVLGFRGDGKSGTAHQADDQNFHKGLADILVARLFQLHFTENVAQAGSNVHTFKMVQNAELTVGIFGDRKFHTFDAQNDVLQRLCVEGDLCVGDVGIDDDQVVGVDRVELVLDEKLTLTAYNLKQLRVSVGMGHGVPVAAVFGAGGI